jgi:DNA-binding transcriptional LysR family regulator
MDLRHIHYFVALYEEQSITKAAKRLNVVQPAVSTQIRRLEKDFNVALFERTSHGVYPTAIARTLYPACIKILADFGVATQVLRESSGVLTGSLRVGVPPSMAQGVVSDILIRFYAEFPSVQVQCYEGYSANLIEWLGQGLLDFAIVNMSQSEQRLRPKHLLTEDLFVVSRPARHGERSRNLPASRLRQYKLVLPTSANFLRTLIHSALDRVGIAITPVLEIDSLAAVFRLISNPGWASIVPEIALRGNPAQQTLHAMRLVEPRIQRSLVIAFHPSREPSLPAQKFIDCLESALKDIAGKAPRHHAE